MVVLWSSCMSHMSHMSFGSLGLHTGRPLLLDAATTATTRNGHSYRRIRPNGSRQCQSSINQWGGAPTSFGGQREHCFGECLEELDRCGAMPRQPHPCLRIEWLYLCLHGVSMLALVIAAHTTIRHTWDDVPARMWLYFAIIPLWLRFFTDAVFLLSCVSENRSVMVGHVAVLTIFNLVTWVWAKSILWCQRRGLSEVTNDVDARTSVVPGA